MPRFENSVVWAALLVASLATACEKESKTKEHPLTSEQRDAVEVAPTQANADAGTPTADVGSAAARPEESAGARTTVEQPLLWKLDGPHGPVYLFGTIHGGVQGRRKDLPRPVWDAFDSSKVIVLEADTEAANDPSLAQRVVLPKGESLKEKLGGPDWKRLSQEVEAVPDAVLNRLRPWAAYSQLVREWLGAEKGIDQWLQIHARAHEKELQYLEKPAEQIDMLESAITVEYLRELLGEVDEQKELMNDLIAAYKTGDVSRIEEVAFPPEDVKEYEDVFEALFWKRNEKWAEKIDSYVERGNVFVAVGAGHLVGERSVLDALNDRGYELERVKRADE